MHQPPEHIWWFWCKQGFYSCCYLVLPSVRRSHCAFPLQRCLGLIKKPLFFCIWLKLSTSCMPMMPKSRLITSGVSLNFDWFLFTLFFSCCFTTYILTENICYRPMRETQCKEYGNPWKSVVLYFCDHNSNYLKIGTSSFFLYFYFFIVFVLLNST